MIVFKNPTILKILDYYKDIWALSYTSGLAHWDLETYMPKMAVDMRGQAMARVSTIRQKMFLNSEFVKLIDKATEQKDLNDYEKGVARVLKQSLKIYQKVPSKFLEELEILTNKSTVVWSKAKNDNDFDLFAPYLSKIFDKNRQFADYVGYKDSPYDALLDMYEEGLTAKTVNQFFNKSIPKLQELLKKIKSSKKYFDKHPLERAKYDKSQMSKLNDKVLKYLWPDYGREGNFRLDESSHPFTTSFSNQDTRITTWYHDHDFARSLMATVHEFGHALYDLQSSDKIETTPIAGGSSLVIHESQSRYWENHIGRSREFIEKFLPDFRLVTGNQQLTASDVYSYFNKVRPSLLRVEADEVTYHMHIALRFEIEKELMEGTTKIKNIKEIWNSKMKEYLGVTPKKDSEGVLQDIHWAHGSVGYFPTYSLGTFLAAQWREKISNLNFKFKNSEDISGWLQSHIHKYGSTYTLEDLLKKNMMQFDPEVNIKYLEEKYSKIYS